MRLHVDVRHPMQSAPTSEGPQEARRSFAEDLDETRSEVIRLAGLSVEAIGVSTRALLDADLAAVERLVNDDARVDALKEATELRVYEMFATQQPMAGDLRTLLAILRILHEIQLTADLTVSIAKGARRLYPVELAPRLRGLLERMGSRAAEQFKVAIDSFADNDPARAAALPDMDDVMDDLQKDLFRAIFETSANDEAGLQQAVQLALLGRFYERMADHAVLIGAWVRFMVTGELPSRADTQDSGTP